MNDLSNENIKDQIRILEETYVPGESNAFNLRALRELLAYREAQGKPYAFTTEAEMLHVRHGSNGYLMNVSRIGDFSDAIPLFAAPPLAVIRNSKDTRNEFESTFPIPKGVKRCGFGYCRNDYDDSEALAFLLKWEGWKAKRESNSPVIPDGWALVPIVPTEEMMLHKSECQHHAWDDHDCTMRQTRRLVWANMIAATPKPNSET